MFYDSHQHPAAIFSAHIGSDLNDGGVQILEDVDLVAKTFRDNDNLGDDSCLLYRTFRQLVHEGKPPG